jgi:hypothetical protein
MGPAEKTFKQLVAQLDYPGGMVLEPVFAEVEEPDGQLTFHRSKRIDPGHEA